MHTATWKEIPRKERSSEESIEHGKLWHLKVYFPKGDVFGFDVHCKSRKYCTDISIRECVDLQREHESDKVAVCHDSTFK